MKIKWSDKPPVNEGDNYVELDEIVMDCQDFLDKNKDTSYYSIDEDFQKEIRGVHVPFSVYKMTMFMMLDMASKLKEQEAELKDHRSMHSLTG